MIDDARLRAWFCEEILPWEAELERFVRRSWRQPSDVSDIRQEIYVLTLAAARNGFPPNPRAHLFTVARNHIINKAKRARIVSFEQITDLESIDVLTDPASTERHLEARDHLRRAQSGMAALPPRCREVVRLRKVEGLSTVETSERLGITVHTVERQLVLGMRAMVDHMLGGDGRIRRLRQTDARRQRP